MNYTTSEEQANFDIWGEQNRRRNRFMQGVSIYRHSRTTYGGVITTTPPYNSAVWKWGIDIAGVWDGIINAAKFKMVGGSFVIVKGKDGTIDGKYIYENIFALQQEGVPYAIYCWLYPNSKVSCKSQGLAAAALAKQLKPKKIFWDYEWTYYGGQPANPNGDDLALVIDACEQAYGEEVGIYSALGYVMDHPVPARFASRPLWDAQYGVLLPTSLPPWGLDFTIWQQSDRWTPASNWGISPDNAKATDGDVMTFEQFEQIFGQQEPTPEPPPAGGTMQYKVVWSKGCNVRIGPSAFDANVYVGGIQKILAYNVVVDVLQDAIPDTNHPDDTRYSWVKIAEGQYAASDYPVNGVPTPRMQLVTTPPPPPTTVTVTGATLHFSDGHNEELVPAP